MAPSIKRPFQARLFKHDVIFWIWFLCAATCQPESIDPSRTTRNANDENSVLDVEIRLMPAIVKPNLAITSTDRKHIGCQHLDCNLSKISAIADHNHMENDKNGRTKAEDSNNLSTTKTSSNQADSLTQVDEKSRSRRSLPEDTPEGFRRLGRGALDKNFLRFGKGGLNKNFLRFGRGSLRQNFLRFGRSDLPRNFLRFGRNDFSGDLPSDEKPQDGNYNSQSSLNDENVDFQNPTSNDESILTAIGNLDPDVKDPELKDEQCDNKNDIVPDIDTSRAYNMEDVSIDSENQNSENENYSQAKMKRGSLSKSYLSLGRYYYPKIFSGKRGSLDRNFLRFGKRWSVQSDLKDNAGNVDNEDEDDNTSSMRRKVKRQINHSTLTSSDNDPDDTLHHQSKKSVLFLATPWLSKNGNNQNLDNDQQTAHGDLIRRRSLDKKVLNDLQNNFIRFGRR